MSNLTRLDRLLNEVLGGKSRQANTLNTDTVLKKKKKMRNVSTVHIYKLYFLERQVSLYSV